MTGFYGTKWDHVRSMLGVVDTEIDLSRPGITWDGKLYSAL